MTTDRPFTYTTMFETVRGIGKLLAPDDFEYVTEIPVDAPESQLVIHLSCMAHYTPQIPHLAKQILQKIGVDCLIVGGPENCCGELHKHFKDTELEKQVAKIVMFGFRRAKPRKVVSICPDCDEVFRAHGVERQPYQHTNISDLFIEYLSELKARMRPVKLRIVPHFHTINAARQRDADNMLAILRTIPWTHARTFVNDGGPGVWLSHIVTKPYATLTTLDLRTAVWVNASADSWFVVAGLVPVSTDISLREGWNLIGYPGLLTGTVGQVLASVSYRAVEGFAPAPPSHLRSLTPTDGMVAGEGYWIWALVPAVITIDNR